MAPSTRASLQFAVRFFAVFCVMLLGATAATAANKTWAGASGNWSDGTKWTDGLPAAPGDTLNFPNIFSNITSTNNLPPDVSFGPITINATNGFYTFTGNRILLAANLSASPAGTASHVWQIPLLGGSNGPIQFSGQMTGNISLNGSNMQFSSASAGPLILDGALLTPGAVTVLPSPSPVVINNTANTYSSPTTVQTGAKLELNGTVPGAVNADGRFSGGGTVGGAVSINSAGVIAPGSANGTNRGLLQIVGALTLAGTYDCQIAKTIPSDQLRVSGSVNITGGLNLSLAGDFPVNAAIKIIDNAGASPVSGTFSGLPDNSVFTINDNRVRINYAAGDGNDVVITVVTPAKHWTGTSSAQWGNPANWAEGAVPANGDRLFFTPTAPIVSTINNIPSLVLDAIFFQKPGYTIGDPVLGNAFTVMNGIDANVGNTTISVQVFLGANQAWAYGGSLSEPINLGTFSLNLTAVGNITKGGTTIFGTGTLFVDSPSAARVFVADVQPNIFVQGSARVVLSSSVSQVQVAGGGAAIAGTGSLSKNLIVSAPNFLSPGSPDTPTPGIIDLVGAPPPGTRLAVSGIYIAELFGSGFGTYDRVNVTGTVDISGATLNGSIQYPAAPGDQFVIIDNDGTDPISGTFAGMPQGAVFTWSGQPLRISYTGGTGNDVTLTRISNPTIASISPNTGSTAGGYNVMISGNEFQPGATLTFGGIAATVVSQNATNVVATVPAGVSGPVSVVYTNPDGGQALGTFTYNAPVIASISPTSGIIGTVITINGASLNSVDTVTIGGVAASFTILSPSQIQATVPVGTPAGNVQVIATSNGFSSNPATFQRLSSPTITSVSPPNGSTAGGYPVTLTGTEFLPGATVSVGFAGMITALSPTSITFTMPAGVSGGATIVVTNPDAQQASAPFTFNAPSITSITPSSAQVGATVTINGASLNSVSTVTFNGVSATIVSPTPTQIQVIVPSVPPGAVTVVAQSGSSTSNSFPFTVLSSPTINTVTPGNGSTAGGITVTLSGSDFLPGATVTVGPNAATVLTIAPSTITFTLPPYVSGPASVVVTNPDSQIATNTFTYDTPSIGTVNPTSAQTGASVTITGASFTGANSVKFGGAAASFTVVSDTQIQATVPFGAPGPASIVVASNTLSGPPAAFTRLSSPVITSVTPNSGPTSGGTPVTIQGSDFVAGATVTVGGVPAISGSTTVTPTTITFTTPGGPSGPATLVVTNPDGQSASSTFTFDSPFITSLSPASGQIGATVAINGTSLSSVTSVTFGGVSATITSISATQLQVTVPAIPAGVTSVVATSGAFASNAVPFTRISNPVISAVNPPSGPTAGGFTVTISGSDFMSGATVTIGGVAATVTSNSFSTITATVPAGSSGPKPVVVTNPDSMFASSTFTYDSPAITAVNPTSGANGIIVTISGTSLNSVTSVTFGGVAATFTVLSATTIQATVPAIPPGPAAVVVASGSFTSSPATFTRLSNPTITSVTPNSGSPAGNITINVSGSELLAGATVTVGGTNATVISATGTSLSFNLPAGSSGPKPLVITNTDGQSATSTFTYNSPSVTGITPSSANVGATITINGSSFSSVTAVTFNGVSAAFTILSDTQITVTVPNVPPGSANVVVQSGAFSNGSTAFTVTCPSLSVTITGATTACAGDNITLTANPSSTPVTYLWSNGATTQSITVGANVPSTSFSVTVTSPTSCVATASHTISAATSTVLTVNTPASVVAGNTATATVVNPPSGATTYNWTVTNGTIVSGQGTTTLTFRAGTSGNVSISVTAPLAACFASAVVNVPIETCATTPATLTSPADGATLNSPVTYIWTPVQNAMGYEVWAGANTATAVIIGTTTTETALTIARPSGPETWFVVARLSSSCSPAALQSASRTYQVAPTTNCPSAPPVAVSPKGSSHVFSPITLQWTDVPDATGYEVSVRSATGGLQDLGSVTKGITTLTVQLPPGDYSWFVAAIYSGCPPVSSAAASFTVDREDCSTHASPALSAPSNGISVPTSTVDFRWTAVEGADGYRLWTFNTTTGEDPAVRGETNDTKLSVTLEPGTIKWFIEALFKGCPSTYSPTQSFVVPAANNCANNVAPSLISPADGQTLSDPTVTFSWSSVGAVEYELLLSVNSGTPALLTRTSSTSFTTQVPQADLEFFVRALFNGCPTLTSQSRRFRYQPPAICSTERPVLIAPQNESTPIPSPVTFRWSKVTGATGYRLGILATDGLHTINTTESELSVPVATGTAAWSVTALFGGTCQANESAVSQFVVVATPSGCVDLTQPIIAAPSQISDNLPYFVQWQPVVGATSYLLQRSTTGTFDNVSGTVVKDTQAAFTDSNRGTEPLILYYRVRPISDRCTPVAAGPFSSVVGVIILPSVQSSVTSEGSTLAAQSQIITYSIQLGPEVAGSNFTATPTAPWISVSPSSGVIPAAGVQLMVTANPQGLPVGTSAGNVIVALSTPSLGSGLRTASHGTSTVTVPVQVNKVNPVSPNPKSAPPPDALIIPAVAHADGINSKFQSDVRITNTSAQVIKYQLTFTPTGELGLADGRQAIVDIEPGRTMALDDVLKTWFGTGTGSALGTLEIRPLTKTASSTSSATVKGLQSFSTFASSRTFNLTTGGTFGQYIPAIPFANFVGRSNDASKPIVLSMQQIAQSADFRTNIGFVEGSGDPASLLVSVFGDKGQKLSEFPVNLTGGQHLQMGSFLAQKGVQVNDGRIEVRVTSPGGKVSAYASVLDNRTNDSLLVTPITIGDTGNTKFVLPGVAELSGGIPWRTDVRVFNASDEVVNATLTFQPLNSADTKTADVQIQPREVKQLDRVLNSMFGITNDGGALHITTPKAVNLIATARTYRPDVSGGSFGQFISAVTANEAAALGSRPLQILQVEESPQFRSNVGIAEVTGRPVTVEITALPPDSKVAGSIRIPMAANQIRQINSLLAQMGLTDTHNARVTVRVVEGQGRVTAYASVIDAQTADPTYVPAQ